MVSPGAAAAIGIQHMQAAVSAPTDSRLPIGRLNPNPSAEPVEIS